MTDNADDALEAPEPRAKPKAVPKPSAGRPPTSKDIIDSPAGRNRRKLETRIAELQDEVDALKLQNQEYEGKLDTLRNTPSQTNPGRSLLDDLEDFTRPLTDWLAGTPPPPPPTSQT